MSAQALIDQSNAAFWSELCGSEFAQSLGIRDHGPESLRRFDDAYFALYPSLKGYAPADVRGKNALEIGLGYGTLGQYIAEQGAVYHGIDIAPTPAAMMQHRLRMLGESWVEQRIGIGSAHAIPFPDDSFDYVFSIGCLHHTGSIEDGVGEIHRALKPGGRAVVMLYYRHSLRLLKMIDLPRVSALFRQGRWLSPEQIRAAYDTNIAGDAAPF